MTDKEKIRAEIERLKESGCASPIVICDTLLSFIASMPVEPKFKVGDVVRSSNGTILTIIGLGQYCYHCDNDYSFGFNIQDEFELVEEPANEDLEKEIDRWSQEHSYNKSEKPVFAAIARHFAKWQKEIDKLIFYNDLSEFEDIKKLVVNEIASINTIETIDTDFDGWYNRLIVFAKRCAQWHKQQMIKDAIEGYVDMLEFPDKTWIELSAIPKDLKDGDKVKLTIIKED